MKKCSNTGVGDLLHGYELNILNAAEADAFELHMLECEYCRNELVSFEGAAEYIRSSDGSRRIVEDVIRSNDSPRSFVQSVVNQIWPRNVILPLRPAFLMVLLMLIVGTKYVTRTSEMPIPQRIYPIDRLTSLASMRTGEQGKIFKAAERNVLTVIFNDISIESKYLLKIISKSDGKEHYSNENTRFNESGATLLLLEPNSLPPGEYLIKLQDSAGNARWPEQQFRYE